MAKGTVQWFNESKEYGFITPEDGNVVNFNLLVKGPLHKQEVKSRISDNQKTCTK